MAGELQLDKDTRNIAKHECKPHLQAMRTIARSSNAQTMRSKKPLCKKEYHANMKTDNYKLIGRNSG